MMPRRCAARKVAHHIRIVGQVRVNFHRYAGTLSLDEVDRRIGRFFLSYLMMAGTLGQPGRMMQAIFSTSPMPGPLIVMVRLPSSAIGSSTTLWPRKANRRT